MRTAANTAQSRENLPHARDSRSRSLTHPDLSNLTLLHRAQTPLLTTNNQLAMSTPTIANANSMLQDIDFPVYHGDDEPVDAPSAAPPADMSSTNDEMQFDFDELEAMIDMPTNIKTGPNAARLAARPGCSPRPRAPSRAWPAALRGRKLRERRRVALREPSPAPEMHRAVALLSMRGGSARAMRHAPPRGRRRQACLRPRERLRCTGGERAKPAKQIPSGSNTLASTRISKAKAISIAACKYVLIFVEDVSEQHCWPTPTPHCIGLHPTYNT